MSVASEGCSIWVESDVLSACVWVTEPMVGVAFSGAETAEAIVVDDVVHWLELFLLDVASWVADDTTLAVGDPPIAETS